MRGDESLYKSLCLKRTWKIFVKVHLRWFKIKINLFQDFIYNSSPQVENFTRQKGKTKLSELIKVTAHAA